MQTGKRQSTDSRHRPWKAGASRIRCEFASQRHISRSLL